MASADQISCRNLGRRSWASAPTPCGGRHAGSSCPTGGSSTTLGSRRIAERLRQWGRGTGRNRSRDHPQSTQQRRAIPQSRRSRDSSLCTREPLGTGDADCRVASLLAMTVLIIPRRPNGPTWESVLFYDGRGFGPPYERRGERHAEVVGPYGKERKPNQPPKPAGAQRSVRARVGEGWAGIGAKAIPKGGPPPRLPVQCLAKRKARG